MLNRRSVTCRVDGFVMAERVALSDPPVTMETMDSRDPPGRPEPLALFPSPPPARAPLGAFRRRLPHHRRSGEPPTPQVWAREHPSLRARAPSGTVHAVNTAWLPVCGAGLNGWDYRELEATEAAVTCHRCAQVAGLTDAELDQLALFPLPQATGGGSPGPVHRTAGR